MFRSLEMAPLKCSRREGALTTLPPDVAVLLTGG